MTTEKRNPAQIYPKAKQNLDGHVIRTTIVLSPQQQTDLQRLVPWGAMNKVMSCLLDEFIELLKKAGEGNNELVVGAILSGRISILDFIRKKESQDEPSKP